MVVMNRDAAKIIIYTAANVLNAARTTGLTIASDKVREALAKQALNTPVQIVDSYYDRLINHGCLQENTVVLQLDDNTEIEIIDAIIDVAKKNNIVSTQLVKRAGTVKERIQEDDYDVTVKGSLMVEERDKFPYTELFELNKILSEATSIKIASVYTTIFGIDRVVMKSADFNQSSMNYFNIMPFTLKFASDRDYDFLVQES